MIRYDYLGRKWRFLNIFFSVIVFLSSYKPGKKTFTKNTEQKINLDENLFIAKEPSKDHVGTSTTCRIIKGRVRTHFVSRSIVLGTYLFNLFFFTSNLRHLRLLLRIALR